MKFSQLGAWCFGLVLVVRSAPGLAAEPIPHFWPMPSHVFEGITSWLWLCDRLGINPGTQTNLAAVDWEHSFTFTNTDFSVPVRTIRVQFMNGVFFDTLGPFAVSHFAPDAVSVGDWLTRSQALPARFYGTVEEDWRQLASGLEQRLVQHLGIPAAVLAQFGARPDGRFPPEIGSYAMKRLVLTWRPKGSIPLPIHGVPPPGALSAEFDLATGELKFIYFRAPELINAMARAQKHAEPVVSPNGGSATPWLGQRPVEGRPR